MINQLKSDIRKLLTVRSTYVLLICALLLTGLVGFFGTTSRTNEVATCQSTGEIIYSADYTHPEIPDKSPEEICGGEVSFTSEVDKTLSKGRLVLTLQETVPLTVTFLMIIFILQIAHEFRYNIINHTLTLNSSRSKVLVSKLVVAIIFTVLATLLAIGVTFATIYIAIVVKGLTLPTQDYNWLYIIGRHITYALGYVLFFMATTLIIRNLAASIVIAFFLPMFEQLGGYLLTLRDINPAKVLPFTTLDRFGNVASDVLYATADTVESYTSSGTLSQPTAMSALGIFGIWLAVLWIVAWVSFLKRDAN